ncbi:MAG: flippase, partial [Comamonadaceae bacterium]
SAACAVAGQAVSLVGLLLIVDSSQDYVLAVAAQGIAPVVASVLAWGWLVRTRAVRFVVPGWSAVGRQLREGWPFFVSTASVSLYTTSNVVLLGLVSHPQVVGYFAAAEKLIRAVQGLLAPVSQAIYPHVTRLALDSRAKALEFLHRLLKYQGSCMLLLSVAVFGLADPIVRALFGAEFVESILVLQCLSALPFIVGLSNVLGVQTMLNFDMQSAFHRLLLAAGFINVTLVLVLAAAFGAPGAALGVVATELIVLVMMGLETRRAGLLLPLMRGEAR